MILWSMALLDGWVTARDLSLLRVSGDGKVNELGRGKKERADVASYCRSELPVLSSEAETNAQTVPHPSSTLKVQILCALTVALLSVQSRIRVQQLSKSVLVCIVHNQLL